MRLSFSLSSQPHHPKPRLKAGLKGNLGDHGVRKYDSEIGRFLTIDPLWEKYNTVNPYQYNGNSPVMMADWNGMETYVKHILNLYWW